MKIALVVYGFHKELGGYGSHVFLYAKELMKKGNNITIISSTYSPKGIQKKGLSIQEGIKILRFNSYFKGITPDLYNHLLKEDYDIVHVYGYQTFYPFIASLAKIKKGFPLIFTPFYHPFGEHNRLLRKFFDSFFGFFSLRNSDVIIAQTELEKNYINNNKVIIRSIPVKNVLKVSSSVFRNKFKLKNQDLVLSVGRLSPEKRFDELISLFKNVKKGILVIAGTGDASYTIKLKELIIKNNLERRVLLTGFLSEHELASAYASASVFVLVSKYESFGLVFAEAMSYGLPCIGIKIGGVPYVINNSGIIVNDLNEVSLWINKLISNKLLRKNLRIKAIKRSKDFSINSFMNDLLKIYDGVIK